MKHRPDDRAYFPSSVTTSQYIYIYIYTPYYSYYTIVNQVFYPRHDGLSRNCLRVSRPFSRHCPSLLAGRVFIVGFFELLDKGEDLGEKKKET